jgi:hypothetical protein
MFLFLYRWLHPRELCRHPQIENPPARRAAYDVDLCWLFEFVLFEIRPRSEAAAQIGPHQRCRRVASQFGLAVASGRSARGGALRKPGLLVEVRYANW